MKHRALIIEDSRTQARQLAALLEQEGFEVEVAPDGERGLAACAARPPDAVLCDIVMPGINGFEVCRRLRARPETRDLPVMLMTSLADTADVVRALAAGADNFVTKPFVPATLVARLRRMLSKRRSLDEGGGVEFRGSRFAVPRPSSLSTVTEPPCASTSPFTIESPRPAPCRAPPSACQKRSKTCGSCAAAIPTPVSCTTTCGAPSTPC